MVIEHVLDGKGAQEAFVPCFDSSKVHWSHTIAYEDRIPRDFRVRLSLKSTTPRRV